MPATGAGTVAVPGRHLSDERGTDTDVSPGVSDTMGADTYTVCTDRETTDGSQIESSKYSKEQVVAEVLESLDTQLRSLHTPPPTPLLTVSSSRLAPDLLSAGQ